MTLVEGKPRPGLLDADMHRWGQVAPAPPPWRSPVKDMTCPKTCTVLAHQSIPPVWNTRASPERPDQANVRGTRTPAVSAHTARAAQQAPSLCSSSAASRAARPLEEENNAPPSPTGLFGSIPGG